MLDSSCWHQLPSKFVVLRPGVAPGQEGAAAAQQDGEMVQVPSVLIQVGPAAAWSACGSMKHVVQSWLHIQAVKGGAGCASGGHWD